MAETPETDVTEQPADSDDSGTESAGSAVSEAEAVASPETETPAEPKRPKKRLPRRLRHKHAKLKHERGTARKPLTRAAKPESERGRRQERRGIVVSDKGDKTIVVSVDVTKLHPRYKKVVRQTRKFHAHDEQNAAAIGDVVRIVETRPLSKTKNWRLAEIVEKAK